MLRADPVPLRGALVTEKGWNAAEDGLLPTVSQRVAGSLNNLKDRGFVRVTIEGVMGVWPLAER
jgi:hypothetical protein